MNVEEQAAVYEAIASGNDPRISPSDRMAAMEKLATLPGKGVPGSAALLEVAGEVAMLSGAALDAELVGFFNPGWVDPPPPPPGSEEAVERTVRRRIRAWAKTQGVRVSRAEPAPRPVAPEPERVAATDDSRSEEAKVVPLSAVEKRRLVRESNRAAQWAERLPPRPEGVSREAWEMYGDEMDGV